MAILAPGAIAGVSESLDYRYYDVHADPAKSLLAALNAATPISEDGKIFHGYTRWNVRWNFWWDSARDGSCRLKTVKTTLSGLITLPKLVGAGTSQREAFDRYVAALKTHELGHLQVGREAAAEIDRGLVALPAMADCKSLESEANAGAYRTLERHKENERRYDADTGHGRTQGAWLER